jgi:hypothetical protein
LDCRLEALNAQSSLEAPGSDFVVFKDPRVYSERFHLNTRSDVLAHSAKQSVLVRFMRAIHSASASLSGQPTESIRTLAQRAGLSEAAVQAV